MNSEIINFCFVSFLFRAFFFTSLSGKLMDYFSLTTIPHFLTIIFVYFVSLFREVRITLMSIGVGFFNHTAIFSTDKTQTSRCSLYLCFELMLSIDCTQTTYISQDLLDLLIYVRALDSMSQLNLFDFIELIITSSRLVNPNT